MTDYDRQLHPGEQQIIRRGVKPAAGWVNRGIISLGVDQQALITGSDMPRHIGKKYPTPAPPPPVTPPTPGAEGIQGYARVAMVTAGEYGGSLDVDDIHTKAAAATLYTVSTFAQLKTALQASGKRYIAVTGSALLDGAGASFSVTNGSFTLDGSDYTGPGMKNYKIVVRCSDVIITEMAMRTGEGATSSASSDRRSITFNPPTNGTIRRIALDHCSLAWGPDVVGSFLYNTEDTTVQYCLVGPCLNASNIPTSPNGYGFNVTTPNNADPATIYTKRMTFYRNLYALNKQRNMKYEHTLGVDAVNNVVYDWGDQAPLRGNPRAVNCMGNIFKKGPETQSSNAAFEGDDNYAQYSASIYHSGDIGITAAGGSFTPTWSAIDGGALRGSVYDGGPTDADHGALTVDTADGSLFTAVVAAAGRTHQDGTDTAVKAHAVAGTSDGYYNGASGAAPHPSWPA